MEAAWRHVWNKELTQDRIQHWIERMSRHIREVIRLEGGNEYREGKDDGAIVINENGEEVISSIRPYNSEARCAEYARRQAGIRAGDDNDWQDC